MKIAITTPTGNIGRALTQILLDKGADLVLLVRDPEKVKDFAQRGATVRQGSLDDEDFLVDATRDVDALFWLTPPDYQSSDFRSDQNRLGKAAARAVRENKISRVVNLSSVGAQHKEGTGPVKGLYDVEKLLDEVAENLVHLRAAYFFENFLLQLNAIKEAGQTFLPVSKEARLPMIATSDIAKVAADRLLDHTWSGRNVLELRGPEDLSFAEAAEQIGRGLEKGLEHVQVKDEQLVPTLKQMGISDHVIDVMLELYQGIDSGHISFEREGAEVMSTSKSLEEFAREVLKPFLEKN